MTGRHEVGPSAEVRAAGDGGIGRLGLTPPRSQQSTRPAVLLAVATPNEPRPSRGWLVGRIGILILVWTGLFGCRPQAQPSLVPTPPRTPLTGATIGPTPRAAVPTVKSSALVGAGHFARWCTDCHGDAGRGDGPLGPGLDPPPTNFRAPGATSDDDVQSHYRAIARGVTGAAMSRYDHILDEQALWDTAFLTWSWSIHPDDLRRGAGAYRAHCAVCHGASGAALASAPLGRPSLVDRSRLEVAGRLMEVHPEIAGALGETTLQEISAHMFTFLFDPLPYDHPSREE